MTSCFRFLRQLHLTALTAIHLEVAGSDHEMMLIKSLPTHVRCKDQQSRTIQTPVNLTILDR